MPIRQLFHKLMISCRSCYDHGHLLHRDINLCDDLQRRLVPGIRQQRVGVSDALIGYLNPQHLRGLLLHDLSILADRGRIRTRVNVSYQLPGALLRSLVLVLGEDLLRRGRVNQEFFNQGRAGVVARLWRNSLVPGFHSSHLVDFFSKCFWLSIINPQLSCYSVNLFAQIWWHY